MTEHSKIDAIELETARTMLNGITAALDAAALENSAMGRILDGGDMNDIGEQFERGVEAHDRFMAAVFTASRMVSPTLTAIHEALDSMVAAMQRTSIAYAERQRHLRKGSLLS